MPKHLDETEGREAPLLWRQPAYLWIAFALALGLGVPALILRQEGGFAQLALLTGAIGFLAALISLAVAAAMGRPPASRREVMLHALWLGVLAALASPIAFQALLNAVEGVEGASGPVGLSPMLPLALWPLALFVGLPMSLFYGLILSFVAFKRGAIEHKIMTLSDADDPAYSTAPIAPAVDDRF
ncbi:MAG: hypothetical protein ABW199_04740 [Caulobacterales bacterium]